ncbi:MAG: DUF885 family protein, partial [Bacteroidota bacterium]
TDLMKNFICRFRFIVSLAALFVLLQPTLRAQSQNIELQRLGADFFAWRAVTQPATGDDIPRIERPDGWKPDVSPEALEVENMRYREFSKRLNGISRIGWTRSDSADFLLLRSAIERVNWELNYLHAPYRNPDFYCHQTLGAVYELLLLSSPMNDARMENILLRLESIPTTLKHARTNLQDPLLPFANVALANLTDVRTKLQQTVAALRSESNKNYHSRLEQSAENAASSLEEYASWLKSKLSTMGSKFSIGREAYVHYLKTVALIPFTPEEMLVMGRTEFSRAVFFETVELNRNAGQPPVPLFNTADEQIAQSRLDEESIRNFLETRNIMTVPADMKHYFNRVLPPHVAPLSHMGVTDDLTSETRLSEDGISYVVQPSPKLSFFRRASAQDPRPLIIHEGVPGHYFQMVRSWRNSDPIRRHYFDSGANEGIGFYVEEMMVQAGLFDSDRSRTREIMNRFLRLRALRVEADIQLATGNFTVAQAADYLASTVPMDRETAEGEAAFFSYNPGQAITYQIGKIQIQRFMTDARALQGKAFSLREFHDYLMVNGNVPIALQRWEKLGLQDEVRKLW